MQWEITNVILISLQDIFYANNDKKIFIVQ